MRRMLASPITETLETWPLAGTYQMRWGRDDAGELWVAVVNRDGTCEAALPYRTYLDMEQSRESSAME
jgi:hypothetical protein